ncbi:magnesium transporter [Sphingobium wenxiniae]|uniref:Magnesium transporter MgtE n=2 Tax=Sphingobium TaxID=165695 RepID=T0HP49_9SPHN|nr:MULTISPECIES: magnesium transporter [Sphingobium]EQB01120.1 magnesium transporter [Sphingobium baderi LL03]KMS61081.1 magnesium transporter [Sphingobium baderi LL03]MBB6192649.1 magnesium transporter [Sphingobium wenxiniae]TWH91510.1 magnesium transporter [Sphingobium wenxiniae]WRD76323.1 magnesium transporter [Sphingobium baderi]
MSDHGDLAEPRPGEQPVDDDAVVDQAGDSRHDEDDRLKTDFVSAVLDAVEEGESERARELVSPLHPADIADLLELTPSERRGEVAAALGDLVGAEVLSELNDYVRDGLLDSLAPEQVAEFARELDTDDAVAIIEDMDDADQQAVLDALDPEDRAAIESALSYPEESAGRLMQRDLIAVPEHMTVGQVIDYLRDNSDLTTDFWEIFVVDEQHKPIGTCQLSWILTCPRSVAMADLMKREQTLIPVDMDQEEVALRFQKYALISAAVVDGSGRLVGMITVDDIVHIISEEAGEDILRLSGAGEGDINEPVMDSYRARVRWLLTNLLTALVASTIIGIFEGTIERMVALATLMPIVAGVGGNAGSQTMAVTVRALATNQITGTNTRRTILREMRVALLNGVTVAAVLGVGVALVFQNGALGAVIAAAMMTNILTAGLAGAAVPLAFDRMNLDPAVASSIFVTMITDSMGFFAFLGLASAAGLTG